MAAVNPPPNLRLPRDFVSDKDKRDYFQQLEFIIFQLWTRTGGGSDKIEAIDTFDKKSLADLISLRQDLGTGDSLTSDETGFSVDSDRLTVDMDEA